MILQSLKISFCFAVNSATINSVSKILHFKFLVMSIACSTVYLVFTALRSCKNTINTMNCKNKTTGCYHDNLIHFEGRGKCLVKHCKCEKFQETLL